MEEILASIRRIIADDDANKSAQRAPEPPKPAAPPATPAPPPTPVPRVAPPETSRAAPAADPPPPSAAVADPEPMSEAAEPDHSPNILDLTESMAAPPPVAAVPRPMPEAVPQFRTIDGDSDVSFDEVTERIPPHSPAAHRESRDTERTQLISSETSAAVDSAFNALAQTVLVQNARTLEDLVREMLRPMLKAWLDDNLPNVVERLVRTEIERVSRGRMG
jgi:uncharacterized protein